MRSCMSQTPVHHLPLPTITLLAFFPTSLSLAHSASARVASFLFHKLSHNNPALGQLDQLCPLPGMLFLGLSTCLNSSHPSSTCSKVTYLITISGTPFNIATSPKLSVLYSALLFLFLQYLLPSNLSHHNYFSLLKYKLYKGGFSVLCPKHLGT